MVLQLCYLCCLNCWLATGGKAPDRVISHGQNKDVIFIWREIVSHLSWYPGV